MVLTLPSFFDYLSSEPSLILLIRASCQLVLIKFTNDLPAFLRWVAKVRGRLRPQHLGWFGQIARCKQLIFSVLLTQLSLHIALVLKLVTLALLCRLMRRQ